MGKKQTFVFSIIMLVSLLLISILAACGGQATPAPTAAPADEGAKPSNPGGPGPAVGLTGDATKGADIYKSKCQSCHGDEGKGGVKNPGSSEDVPELNPIDPTIANADAKVFATNVDLFVEHGSKPEGDNPTLVMKAFGDTKELSPQEIADVIAYVISLNKK